MRRLLALLTVICLLAAQGVAARCEEGFTLAAESDTHALYVDLLDARFYVVSKATGRVYHGYPADWQDDPYAKGANKKLIASLLAIETYNDRSVSSLTNCRAGSIEKEDFEGRLIENGFAFDFRFPSLEVALTLRVTLEGDALVAQAPLESVVESEKARLASIILLPFFCSGREDGYLLLPDGCGALIDFDVTRSFRAEIARPLYGRDAAAASLSIPREEEAFRLPVFGAKTGETALLGVVEGGEAACVLRTLAAGDNAQYFRVFPSFVYRELQTVALFENTANERAVSQVAARAMQETPTVRYLLLEGEHADYSGMAAAYRQRLLATGGIVPRDTTPALVVRLYGAVRKRVVTLGVPHDALTTLTTFAQAREIADALDALGVRAHLLLTGFSAAGTRHKNTQTPSPMAMLGGEKGLRALITRCEEAGFPLAMTAEMIAVRKDGYGYRALSDATRFASDGIAWQYAPDRVDYGRDYTQETVSLLMPQLLAERLSRYAQAAEVLGVRSVEVADWGERLYAQQGKRDRRTRDEALACWKDAADGLNVSVVAGGGNAYVLDDVSRLTGLSANATGFDLETRPIPFYQMVVHGLIPYSGAPLNAADDAREELLRMLEYGADPSCDWFYTDDLTATQFTLLTDVYSGNYRVWLDAAKERYAAALALHEISEGSQMARHDALPEGIARVTYQNGARLYVNYTSADVAADGLLVPARGYIMEGKP